MLVKKIKTVSPEGTEPSTEERYLVTADINRMAQLIGLDPAKLRDVVRMAAGDSQSTYYGEARSSEYFHHLCNVFPNITPTPRKLELDNIHLRVAERIKTDASGAFLIVPLTVTAPDVVGDIRNGYELIPHIVIEACSSGDESVLEGIASVYNPFDDSVVYNLLTAPRTYGDFNLKLVGFDLVLQDAGPTPVRTTVIEGVQLTTPTNTNRMVYDFGFGVTVRYELVDSPVLPLSFEQTVYRNDTPLTPGIMAREITNPRSLLEAVLPSSFAASHDQTRFLNANRGVGTFEIDLAVAREVIAALMAGVDVGHWRKN